MKTQNFRKTRISRDPFINLERELRIRGFSDKTVKSYLYYNKVFIDYANKSPKEVRNEDIKKFLEYLVNKGMATATLNLVINALKFYYIQILKRKLFYNIKYVKKNKKLPIILSKSEIKRMIAVTNNPKHKFLIQFLYATGLRVSEVVKVKMSDINLDRKLVLVNQGKGKKDRYTLLADSLIKPIKKQKELKEKNDYLFTSKDGKGHWQVMSAQKVIKAAANKARIDKNVSAHTLRHSFATHLLEEGNDIRYIQELLGHKRLETTQVYTKLANNSLKKITNPLDSLS